MIALLWSLLHAHAQVPAEAAGPVVEETQAQAMRQVIDDQIDAFRGNDAAGAWRLVAPGLQRKFGTAERFLEMVRLHYAPVYQPKGYVYRDVVRVFGGFGQWMDVTGPRGERVRALYLMEQQPDGTWRTMGCLLYEPEDAGLSA